MARPLLEMPWAARKEKKRKLNAWRRKEMLFIEGIPHDKLARAVPATNNDVQGNARLISRVPTGALEASVREDHASPGLFWL